MAEATLELVRSKQAELAILIEELQRKAQAATLHFPATDIALLPGEWYAGPVLNEDGSVKHRVIVAATSSERHTFEAAQTYATARGLSAPTIQESRLIVAHHYGRLAKLGWIWTSEPHSNPAYAWYCDPPHGFVYYHDRSAEGGAVAVRRLLP